MPHPKQTMNKIDAGSIRVCLRQMVWLAATSEIHGVPVCDFMLFYDGHNGSKFKIYIHVSFRKTFNPLAFSYLELIRLFFSPSPCFFFFHCFSSFFVFTKHIVLLHSLLEGAQKLKYPNVALWVVLKDIFSSSNHIKQKSFAGFY